MNSRRTPFARLRLLTLLAAGLAPALATAQEPVPAVLPEVLFLVEESNAMKANWAGDPTLTAPLTRWAYVRSAIQQVIQNAPVSMTFGVALTGNGDEAPGIEFEQLAYPGTPTATMVSALNSYAFPGGAQVTWAESYTSLLDDWAELPAGSPRSWNTGPFQYYCSELIIIVIGFSTGEYDADPTAGYYQSTITNDVLCNDLQSPGQQGCFLDNAAAYAYNSFAPVPSTAGSTKTFSLLIDSAVASVEAQTLLDSVSDHGQGGTGLGIYHRAAQPGAIATELWNILSDTFNGTYSNAAISLSPTGDTMFATYFDVDPGFPLFKGHMLAWQIDDNPQSATYGEIIPSASGAPAGAMWDAGQKLASRTVNVGDANQGTFTPSLTRNGYTSRAAQAMMSTPLPFDSTEIYSGSDLVTLVIDEVSSASNPTCATLPHDFDYDCDSDLDDAQILIDFLRGVPTATFLSTGQPRDTWRMGDTGHATVVAAPSQLNAIAMEEHFQQYRNALAQYPSVAYIASNGGMLHAINLDTPTLEGSEMWFYVPRVKLSKDPASVKEYDGFQADDLMRSGQTYVDDGRLTLEHVWLDGYSNGLVHSAGSCPGTGYVSSLKDGSIDMTGCEWHRVLVWSGGYGASHTYALDVSDPRSPYFLWERTDMTNTGGRQTGRPAVGPFWDGSGAPARRWLAIWGSGAQPPDASASAATRSQAGIYIHDLDIDTTQSPTDYPTSGYPLPHPSGSVTDADSDGFAEYPLTEPGMFGIPSVGDLDGNGSLDVAFIGDSMGYIFKVMLSSAAPATPVTCLFSSPASGDAALHAYYAPALFFSDAGELQVWWGSGSPYNVYSADAGGIYAKTDPTPFGCSAGVATACAGTSGSVFDTTGFYALGTSGAVGEKLVGSPTVRFGRMFFATHIPGSDACALGTSRLYALNVATCGGGLFDDTTDSYSVTSNLYTEVPGLISEPVFANGQLYALNIDSTGLDADSPIDDLDVVPSNFTSFTYIAQRQVF